MNKPEDFQVGTRVLIGESDKVHVVSCEPFSHGGIISVYLKDLKRGKFRGCYNIDYLKIFKEEKHHGS